MKELNFDYSFQRTLSKVSLQLTELKLPDTALFILETEHFIEGSQLIFKVKQADETYKKTLCISGPNDRLVLLQKDINPRFGIFKFIFIALSREEYNQYVAEGSSEEYTFLPYDKYGRYWVLKDYQDKGYGDEYRIKIVTTLNQHNEEEFRREDSYLLSTSKLDQVAEIKNKRSGRTFLKDDLIYRVRDVNEKVVHEHLKILDLPY